MTHALRPLAFAVALGSTAAYAVPGGESTITLGEISVVGNANKSAMAGSSRVLTSVDVMGAERIEQQNVSTSWELLGQMPGIQLTETGQGQSQARRRCAPSMAKATSMASRR